MDAYSFSSSSSSFGPGPALPLPPTSFSPSDGIWTSVNPFDDSSSVDKNGRDGATGDGLHGRKSSFFLPTAIDGEPVRTVQACQSCRARKAKCDGLKESCSRCIKYGQTCCYGLPRRIRGPNKSRSIPSLPKSTSNLSSSTPVPSAYTGTTSSSTAPCSSSAPLFTSKALVSKQPFRCGSVVDLGSLNLGERKSGWEGSRVGGTRGKMDKTLARVGNAAGAVPLSTATVGGRRKTSTSPLPPSSVTVSSLPLVSPGSELPHHLSIQITPFSHPSYFPPPPEPDRRLSLPQPFPSSYGSSAPLNHHPQPPPTQLLVHHCPQSAHPANLSPSFYAEPNPRSHPHFSERGRSSTTSHRSHPYYFYPHQQQPPTSPTIYTPSSPLNQPSSYPETYFPASDYVYPNPTPIQVQYPPSQYPSPFQQHRGFARASVTSSTYSFAPTMHSSANATSTSSTLPSPGGFSNREGGWATVGGGEGSRRESYQSFDMVPPELVFPQYGAKGGDVEGLHARGRGENGEG